MIFEFRCVGSVDSVDYFALKGDQNFRFAGRTHLRNIQRFNFLLGNQDDIDSFLKLIDYASLEVFIEGH